MNISSLMLDFEDLNTLVFTENIFKDIQNEVKKTPKKTEKKIDKFVENDDDVLYYDNEENLEDESLYPADNKIDSHIKVKKDRKFPSCERKFELKVKRNARERRRVQQLSEGFKKLRNAVPVPCGKKLSKLETLRNALDYISELKSTLEYLDSRQVNTSSQIVPQFTPTAPSWGLPMTYHAPTPFVGREQGNNPVTVQPNTLFRSQLEAMQSFFTY